MARLAGWPANTKPAMKTKGNARVLEFRDNDSSSTRAARRPSPPFQVIKKNFPYFSPIIVVKQKKKKKTSNIATKCPPPTDEHRSTSGDFYSLTILPVNFIYICFFYSFVLIFFLI